MALSKADARSHGCQLRESIAEQDKLQADQSICRLLAESVLWADVDRISAYQAIESNNEIDLQPLITWLQLEQPDIEISLQSQTPDFPATQMDLVIAPCLAIDESGNRVGYGGGGYDSFMQAQKSAKLVVVCYEGQVVPRIAPEEHDVPASLIVTEKHIRRLS